MEKFIFFQLAVTDRRTSCIAKMPRSVAESDGKECVSAKLRHQYRRPGIGMLYDDGYRDRYRGEGSVGHVVRIVKYPTFFSHVSQSRLFSLGAI